MAGEGEGETLAGFSCAVTRSDERGTFTAGSARRGASSVRPLLHSSFFIRNVRPADSCYIRLTRLLSQVVSQGLQFLHNRRRRAADRQRRRRRRQGGRAGNPVENVAPGWSARSRPRLTTSSAMVPPPTRTYLRSRALATTDAPIRTLIATDAHPSTPRHRRRRAPIHTAPPHHRPTTAGSHHPHRSAVAAALPLRADPDHARCRILPIRPRSATALNRRSRPLLPLRLTKTLDLGRSHFCRFSTISLSPGVFQTSPTPDPPPETKNRSKSTSFANAWQVRTI